MPIYRFVLLFNKSLVALGGLVVACLSLDRSFAGSNPAEDDGIFNGDKICSTTSFGGEVNRRSHLVRFYGMLKNHTGIKDVLLGKIISFATFLLLRY
jgi:hypothetical protein